MNLLPNDSYDTTMIAAPTICSLPEGLVIELSTPLTPIGGLDRESLARLVKRTVPASPALAAGLPGVGEGLDLPDSLRLELFTTLLQILPDWLPLFFGITGAHPDQTLSLARRLEAELQRFPIPPPVYWVDLPLWGHSNRGLPQSCHNLLQYLSRPLVLMNHPQVIRSKAKFLKHINLRTAVFKKLALLPQVSGLIYQGDMRRFLHYCAALATRPDFILYEADEYRFLTRPGARGLFSSGAQLFPSIWQQVAQVCWFPEDMKDKGGRSGSVWEWSELLLRLHDLYRVYPAALLKAGLHHLGVLDFPAVWPSTETPPAPVQERFLAMLAQVQGRLDFNPPR
ncbi:dihydrodipicolinate synthase family protein [Desulfobacca acetoxidans]|uniref:Dihydrodipicolinate synthase family protein n=1 Tax=Desulfobacca acetoxidans (strain ATCC 700848 / DSM 11109 / ASRB2) TaxID=880072 RepID=F2NGG7_DESAR|nr:hypothetical protein [Desulfobacca acetoxidans]AEB08580.1 hypothetical protein Desac_0700 [Desulfobacca acetoxidans DSM 11109]